MIRILGHRDFGSKDEITVAIGRFLKHEDSKDRGVDVVVLKGGVKFSVWLEFCQRICRVVLAWYETCTGDGSVVDAFPASMHNFGDVCDGGIHYVTQ